MHKNNSSYITIHLYRILIMYHYLICCKLTFYLHKNNKLHTLNINDYKYIFQNLIFKFNFNIYMPKKYLHHT
jgi:hypothetical protein